MDTPKRHRFRTLGMIVTAVVLAIAVGGVTILSFAVFSGTEAIQSLRTEVDDLHREVDGLKTQVEAAQSADQDLATQVQGAALTLQDVYFEQLKKNDGLVPVWTDPRPGRRAYLTFDDGPSQNTPALLEALQAAKAKATFFVNGRPEWSSIYQRIVATGNKLGNHTYSHDYQKIYASVPAFLADTDRLETFLATLGIPAPKVYRFPGGAKNEIAARIGGPDLTGKITAAMADRGYRFFEWNVAVGDGESKPNDTLYTSDEIRKAVAIQTRNKRIAVILLHDGPGHKATAKAVPGIIADLKRAGFSLEVLP